VIHFETELDALEVQKYIEREPGFPYAWSVAGLRACTLLRVLNDQQRIGYCWFNQLPEPGDTVQFHACISFDWCGRWMTRRSLRQLLDIGKKRGIRAVVSSAHEEWVANIWQRMGARIVGPFAIFTIDEAKHGISRRRSEDEAAHHGSS